MPCILSGDTTTTVGRLGHHHNVQDELSTLFGEEYGNNDTGGGTSVDNTEMTMTTILYPIDRRRNVTRRVKMLCIRSMSVFNLILFQQYNTT
jgi:hypothetical protein